MIAPNNEEAEKGLIGCMILDNDIINLTTLKKEDFFTSKNQKLFKLIKNLYKQYSAVDLLILKDKLPKGLLDSVGGAMGLVKYSEDIHSANWKDYEKIIKDKSHRRQVIQYAQEIQKMAYDETEDTNEVFNKVENISEHIFDIKPTEAKGGMEEYMDSYEIIREKTIARGGQMGMPSLYKVVDKYTQGMIEGMVYTVAAYSNVGKSKFSYTYITDMLKQGKKVIVLSLEVGKGMLFSNLLASFYDKPYNDILKQDFTYDIADFEGLEIYDDVRKLEDVKTLIRAKKPDFVVIDFIQNIECAGTETEKMTKIAIDLQKVAIETQSIIMNISQANNDSRFKGGEAIQPKGSGAIFASTDVLFTLWRDGNQMMLTVAKNKFGPASKNFLLQPNSTFSQFKVSEEIVDKVESKGFNKLKK